MIHITVDIAGEITNKFSTSFSGKLDEETIRTIVGAINVILIDGIKANYDNSNHPKSE